MGLINMSGGMGGGVPTVAELERHYFELHEQKRRMEEMVERTEKLMVGVKRGIDEMRGTSQAPGQSRQGSPVQQPTPLQQGSPLARGLSQPQQQQQGEQHQQSPQPQQQPQEIPTPSVSPSLGSMGAPAVPLARPTQSGERRDSVWPVVDSAQASAAPSLGTPMQT